MVLSTFGRPARFQFFELLATPQLADRQPDRQTAASKISPGSSGAKKLSIPISFVSVLNTFGSPTRFQFFWFLTTLQLSDRQRQPCQRCGFNIPRACAGKWTLTDIFEAAQYRLAKGVRSIFPEPVQENGL